MKKFSVFAAALFAFCCFGMYACGGENGSSRIFEESESSRTHSDEESGTFSARPDASGQDSSFKSASENPFDSINASDSVSDSENESFSEVPSEEKYAKVVLMAGQSNMLGCTFAKYLSAQSLGQERYDTVSQPFENIRILIEGEEEFIPVALGQGNRPSSGEVCFGPEVGMAEALTKAFPGEEMYLIKAAYGGTSLAEDWRGESRKDQNGNVSYCYHLFETTVKKGMEMLFAAGVNPKIVGMCWMQGEADAESGRQNWSLSYESNLEALIFDVRTQFDAYAFEGESLNFIDAYISDSPDWTFYENVNAAKLRCLQADSCHYLLDTLAPDLVEKGRNGLIFNREDTTLKPDIKHYDSTSMLKLGNMFGEAIADICRAHKEAQIF